MSDKKKILVIDDEPNIVTYLGTLLRDNGYEVVTAANGKEGFEKAKKETPHLVCLDISMPEESGVRFYRDLKDDANLKDTPVLVVTAITGKGGDPEPFKRFLSTRRQVPPPEGFFSKPIDQEKFLAAVAKILG